MRKAAEVYVQTPLDRDQFRKLCDRYRKASAILRHLNRRSVRRSEDR